MANPTLLGIDVYDLIVFIIILLGTSILARLVYASIRRLLDLRWGKRRSKVFANILEYVVMSIGLGYGILSILKLDMAALAASLGLVGIAIAFSSQQIIQNFAAGLLIAIERRVQLEDWIEITGDPTNLPARVVDVTLTRTILRDNKGRIIIVPNSLMVTSRVVNYTKSGFVMVTIPFPIPLNTDRKIVIDVINHVLEKHQKVLPNVQGEERTALLTALKIPQLKRLLNNMVDLDQFRPEILIQDLTTLRITLSIRVWMREVQYRDQVVSEILTDILDQLEVLGIKPS